MSQTIHEAEVRITLRQKESGAAILLKDYHIDNVDDKTKDALLEASKAFSDRFFSCWLGRVE